MKARAKILLAACFVAGVALAIWLATPAEEPSYHGKTLSYWLGGDDPLKDPHGLYSETEEREARVAIRTMGKRCIPELLRMVAAHSWLLEFELRRKPARLQAWYLKSKLRDDLDKNYAKVYHERKNALQAFAILGPDAAPAVPKLIRLLEDPDFEVRAAAAEVLCQIGPPARRAVPALAIHLNDVWRNSPDGTKPFDDRISSWAYAALGTIPHPPEIEIQILVANLKSPTHETASLRCLYRLYDTGSAASNAIPVVLPFLDHRYPLLREAATNCLRVIRQKEGAPSD